MSPLQEIQEMESLVADINAILRDNGLPRQITMLDVTITKKSVSDIVQNPPNLSNAIIDAIWPSVSDVTVYHYTQRGFAESILNSNTFRFTTLKKRIREDEIKTFCVSHGLDGYLSLDNTEKPVYAGLAEDLYYASFTDADIEPSREEEMWTRFAQCDGVRLKIDVTAKNPDFRKIKYENSLGEPIRLLSELSSVVRTKYRREFMLKGVSRLAAFYLPSDKYGAEGEIRALYKVFEGYGPQPKRSGEWSYIDIPLNIMSPCGYKLEVTEVHARVRPDMPDGYAFSVRGA